MGWRQSLQPCAAGFVHFCRFPWLIRHSGLPLLCRRIFQKKNVTILLYHRISPESFDRHVTELKKFYNIISLKEYCERRFSGRPMPEYSLIITFDDGHKNLYDLLPVIRSQAIPVTMFLCTAIVDTNREFWDNIPKTYAEIEALKFLPQQERIGYLAKNYGFTEEKEYEHRAALNKAEILEMSRRVDFQPHGRFHRTLPTCTDAMALEEIQQSKVDMLKEYGIDSYAFAYTNGDYSLRDIEIIKSAGFKIAVTVDGVYNTPETDPYRIKRLPIREHCGIDELIIRASGLWFLAWRTIIGQKHGLQKKA